MARTVTMLIEATPLDGLKLVRPEHHNDARGSFARLWDDDAFAAAGIGFRPRQISVSCNAAAGTLRGLHWQVAPFAETKLVRASQGRVFDVAVDLRPASPTRCHWFGVELAAASHLALLIPAGFAHGFITLTGAAEVIYCIDAPYTPSAAAGARYDDPAFGIVWPRAPAVIAEKDLGWPAFG